MDAVDENPWDRDILIQQRRLDPYYGVDCGKNPTPPIILSSSDFVTGFQPPDYLVDGVCQRRFIYSLTAPTGSGKIAWLLLLAASTALGTTLANRDVERGRVIYFAGENPDDVRMRWIVMAEKMAFDIDAIEFHFIPGTFDIPKIEARIRAEAETLGGFALAIVDTSAAYFQGNDENSNSEMGKYARQLRRLTTLPGQPCVIVACHPVKNASNDNCYHAAGVPSSQRWTVTSLHRSTTTSLTCIGRASSGGRTSSPSDFA